MKNVLIFTFLLLGLVLVSCKKDKDDNTLPNETISTPSCASNSGAFEIGLGGNQHILKINDQTHFTILYNWYGEEENNLVIIGEDQNDKSIYIEGILPEKLSIGSHHFNANDFDFFDIDLDTSNYYTSELTINVIESNLNLQEGVYKPIRGTFEGVGHSYPWINGQPPADTITYSGEFCLNGFMME
ncbi:MAG: hypothetical protein WEA99_09855 [Brumimicrobium sp.]